MKEPIMYTALTIGPIYKTLSQARKTRELWGASYLFSYLMRRIIEGLDDTSNCILPYHQNMLSLAHSKGAGLFPDRLIFEGDVSDKILEISKTVIKEIAKISELPEDYLNNYFRISTLVFKSPLEIPLIINYKEDKNQGNESTSDNIVFIADKLLDSTELHEKYSPEITGIDWKKALDKLNGKLFYKEAFSGKDSSFRFPSVPEIATDDFRKKDKSEYYKIVKETLNREPEPGESEDESEENNQKDFLTKLKSAESFRPLKLRPYHKYIAVVQADGDNIGTTVRLIGKDPENVKNFSSALFEFDIEAVRLIKEYGGKAVYIGGDDLLFFAPVAVARVNYSNENSENPITYLNTLFSLIQKLDEAFKSKVIDSPALKHLYEKGGELEAYIPSMSYGISITYSKYPLNEAREKAYHNLEKAKEKKDDKNKICFSLQKHSGQSFGFIIDKKQQNNHLPESFNKFITMVSAIPIIEGEKLLTSVIYKLAPLHALLVAIAHDENRLYTFFEQEFDLDRDEHRMSAEEKAKKKFIHGIVDFYYSLATEFKDDNNPLPQRESEDTITNIGKLYSTLRFVKHLTDEEDEQ